MCVHVLKSAWKTGGQKRRGEHHQPLTDHPLATTTLAVPSRCWRGKLPFSHCFRTAKVTINLCTNHWHYLLNPVIGLWATLGLTLIYNFWVTLLLTDVSWYFPQERCSDHGKKEMWAHSLCSTLIPHMTYAVLQHLVTDDLKKARSGHLHNRRWSLSPC